MEGRRIGRYVIGSELASGGMATVHLGRMQGPAGFGKTVAVKRLHPQFAKDPEFAKMFIDEARVTAGLAHPNIVMTLDVLEEHDGLYLVMEYVHGVSLTQIDRKLDKSLKIPVSMSCAILASALDGLHAAHTATDEHGTPLGIVHRDVSPQNILIGFNGITKIADFGVAKAAGRIHSTGDGATKGKISYMAPEQVRSEEVSPRTDVFAAGVVLWECLTRRRLIDGSDAPARLRALLELEVVAPSMFAPEVPPALDSIVLRALSRDPAQRFAGAKEMALALQSSVEPARDIDIAEFLRTMLPRVVADRDRLLTDFQRMVSPGTGSSPALPTYATPAPLPVAAPTPRRAVATEVMPNAPLAPPRHVSSPPASPADTSAGNVSINDYLQSPRVPQRASMPAGVLAALIVLPLLGLAGTALVVASVRGKPRTSVAAAPPSAVVTTTAVAPPPPPVASEAPETAPSAATEPEPAAAEADSAEPPATSATAAVVHVHTASTATAAKPVSSATKKCHIVAKPDASGRMKFEEVCSP